MRSLTKAFVTAGLALLLLTAADAAQASSLTQAQISAIVSLLQAFGADQTTIATVEADLSGTASAGSVANSCAFNLNQDLQYGDQDYEGNTVGILQSDLIKAGLLSAPGEQVRGQGNGGYDLFGNATLVAVKAFQAKYGIPASGYGGSLTRAQLNQLYGCGNSNGNSSSSISASTPSSCSQFANLQRGDTDSTTSGLVSQLQQFLGITPTTGYYGVLTSIGYTNKCLANNAQPASVSGMSEWMGGDPEHDFTFWYPSSWKVEGTANGYSSLDVFDSNGNKVMTLLETGANSVPGSASQNAWNPSIEGYMIAGLANTQEYYFDSNTGQWMYGEFPQMGSVITTPADVSVNTMGGLHILSWPNDTRHTSLLVPLSATLFVDIEATGNNVAITPLVDTIVATDPTIAIPVPTTQQTTTIQAEASAYSGQ